jgi:hypothetical protein
LSDPNGTISETFGLRFDLPDYLIELYKSLKIDLPVFGSTIGYSWPLVSHDRARTILMCGDQQDDSNRPHSRTRAGARGKGDAPPSASGRILTIEIVARMSRSDRRKAPSDGDMRGVPAPEIHHCGAPATALLLPAGWVLAGRDPRVGAVRFQARL